MGATVRVYTTPNCHYCQQAKDYLTEKGIVFEAIDVTADKEALAEMKRISGARSVPVVCIGEEVIVGFEKADMERALKALG